MEPAGRDLIRYLFPVSIVGLGPVEQAEAALMVARIAAGERPVEDLADVRAYLVASVPWPIPPGVIGLIDGVMYRCLDVLGVEA